MPELVVTRGLPASGKTTYAKAWVAADPANRARVNRDDLRAMLHAGFVASEERRLTVARDALVRSLLRAGKSVIVDDTNLRQRYVMELAKLAYEEGVAFWTYDFTHISVDECIRRDQGRAFEGPSWSTAVGEKVIRDIHAKFLAGKTLPLPHPVYTPDAGADVEPYVPIDGTPDAILVDLDGTLALMGDRRGPFEWDKVGLDEVNKPVAAALFDSLAANSSPWSRELHIIFLSARDEVCREATLNWLEMHDLIYDAADFDTPARLDTRRELFMRPAGDTRKDTVVKLEIFNNHIRHNYNVRHVWDDRNQVVALWRRLGLACFQVNDGDF